MRRCLPRLAAPKQDYYRVLGVAQGATAAEIKKAYKVRAAEIHPDVSARPNAANEFTALSEAYQTLSDDRKRRFYDYTGAAPGAESEMKGFEDFLRQQQQQQQQQSYEQAYHRPRGFHNPWEGLGDHGAHYAYASGPSGWSREDESAFAEGFDPRSVFGMGMGMGPFSFGGMPGEGFPPGWTPFGARGKPRRAPRAEAARAGAQRGKDVTVDARLTFSEAVTGSSRLMTYTAPGQCAPCGGTGTRGGAAPQPCPACAGRGAQVVQMSPAEWYHAPCEVCSGTGDAPQPHCSSCKGRGQVDLQRSVTVGIPPGVGNENTLRMEGLGGAGRRGGAAGDLVLRLRVPGFHDNYSRQGGDLHVVLPVPITTALLGGTVTVPPAAGSGADVSVEVPPGSHHGTRVEIPGKGLYLHPQKEIRITPDGKTHPPEQSSDRTHGDLVAHVALQMPTTLSEEQKGLLRQFAALSPPPKRPSRAALKELRAQLMPSAGDSGGAQQHEQPPQQERTARQHKPRARVEVETPPRRPHLRPFSHQRRGCSCGACPRAPAPHST